MPLDKFVARGWHYSAYRILLLIDYHPAQNCPKLGPMTVPKFHFIILELSPCDNYRSVTIFWLCPEVVAISDKHCICLFLDL